MLTTNFHGAVANLIAVSGDGERVQAQRHPRSFRSLRKETFTKLADNSYKTTQTCNTWTDGQRRTCSSRAREASNSNTGNDYTRMKMMW